jgi:hypothetical protein
MHWTWGAEGDRVGVLAERMERLVVRVQSPDRYISAVLSHPLHLDVTFTPGTYRRYREHALERQLDVVATRLWTGHRRGYLHALSEALGEPDRGERDQDAMDIDPHSRRYQEAAASIVARGESPGRDIHVTTTALVRWEFAISTGTVHRVGEDQFRRDLVIAARSVLDGYLAQVRELKNEHFGRPETRGFDPWVDGRVSW